jgi:hypothetical protein
VDGDEIGFTFHVFDEAERNDISGETGVADLAKCFAD